ncbi:hypothetical protein LTR47_006099 [Exophiala xenobiotica]|nr:hypothetical protein LTR72_009639 [Exophiala xenobiotica]KAK5232872.1 hypothetical protein LTR47_006099 [Exophiala xenobiotica]KAK5255390.1 hypothetical protein LTS06_000411 [Exophiala xenobiotica]KAK5279731.1 hypothetical protein LTR40_007367 [Exophiala xenobiotica]KAK5287963.1 hypothetical protein LTR14_008746 [Exophiala xenobiotica]
MVWLIGKSTPQDQRALVLVKPLVRRAAPAGRPQLQSPHPNSTRQFVTSPCLAIDRRRGAGRVKIVTIDDKIAETFILDDKIDSGWVRQKTQDNKLSDPQLLRDLLLETKRSNNHVLQLSKPNEGEVAIVQVVDRKDLVKRINTKETAARQTQLAQKEKKPKQIEINWAISGNDLQLKMKQLEEFLRKGKKVELLFAAKRHQRKAAPEEAEELLQAVREKVQEVGASEVAAMEGGFPRQATMTIKIP